MEPIHKNILVGIFFFTAVFIQPGFDMLNESDDSGSYKVTHKEVNEDYFILDAHQEGWRMFGPNHSLIVLGFIARMNNGYDWWTEKDGGMTITFNHFDISEGTSRQVFRKTYAERPVHFATDWVLDVTESLIYPIDLNEDQIRVGILNANSKLVEVEFFLLPRG